LIADDEAGDMALLKIELPAARKLVPIPLSETGVKIGEDVCALGFPGVMSESITLTLTKGVVSTLPAPDDDDGYIATDC
jgi:S1-C subfamily serine protease